MVGGHQLLIQLDDGVQMIAQGTYRVVAAVVLHGAGNAPVT